MAKQSQLQTMAQQLATARQQLLSMQQQLQALPPTQRVGGQVGPTPRVGEFTPEQLAAQRAAGLTPEQVVAINRQREARVAAGLDPYTGLPIVGAPQLPVPQLPTPQLPTVQQPQIVQHQIVAGENLTRIAARYNTTVEAIMAANVGNPAVRSRNLIIAGGTINIPQPVSTLPPALQFQQRLLDEEHRKITAPEPEVPTRVRAIERFLAEFRMPAPPSMVQIFQTLRGQYAVGTDEQELATVRQQIAGIQSLYETAITREEERFAPISIIRRRQQRLTRDMQMELSALTRREATLVESLNQKYKMISDLMEMYRWDYQTASRNYMNEFNVKFQVLQYLRGEEKYEENRAQANWTTLLNSARDIIKTGKATWENLPPNVLLDFREMETRIGLPRGFSEWVLKNTPMEKEIQTTVVSDDKTQVIFLYKDGTSRTFSTGFAPKVDVAAQNKADAASLQLRIDTAKDPLKLYEEILADPDVPAGVKQHLKRPEILTEFRKQFDEIWAKVTANPDKYRVEYDDKGNITGIWERRMFRDKKIWPPFE